MKKLLMIASMVAVVALPLGVRASGACCNCCTTGECGCAHCSCCDCSTCNACNK